MDDYNTAGEKVLWIESYIRSAIIEATKLNEILEVKNSLALELQLNLNECLAAALQLRGDLENKPDPEPAIAEDPAPDLDENAPAVVSTNRAAAENAIEGETEGLKGDAGPGPDGESTPPDLPSENNTPLLPPGRKLQQGKGKRENKSNTGK